MFEFFAKAAVLLVLAGLVLALGGCREGELGRPLFHDKGTYRGPADEPLPPGTVEQLRQRVGNQAAGGL